MAVHAAGDAEEIAEASAAIFSGRIRGLEIARALGVTDEEVPPDWIATGEILKSKPGAIVDREGIENSDQRLRGSATSEERAASGEVFPVLHCFQEIPCNPCTSVCPRGLIRIDGPDIRSLPRFVADEVGSECIGCLKCVTICPGLAISLVDRRTDPEAPRVTLPFEYGESRLNVGDRVVVLDTVGGVLGESEVVGLRAHPSADRTVLVTLLAASEVAERIAGIRVQEPSISEALPEPLEPLGDETIVCRCERVTAGEIRECIRAGYRDMNEIKAVTRAGMGACGGKTCTALIRRLFREEGVPLGEVTENVRRPLFVEVPLGTFAGVREEE